MPKIIRLTTTNDDGIFDNDFKDDMDANVVGTKFSTREGIRKI